MGKKVRVMKTVHDLERGPTGKKRFGKGVQKSASGFFWKSGSGEESIPGGRKMPFEGEKGSESLPLGYPGGKKKPQN